MIRKQSVVRTLTRDDDDVLSLNTDDGIICHIEVGNRTPFANNACLMVVSKSVVGKHLY